MSGIEEAQGRRAPSAKAGNPGGGSADIGGMAGAKQATGHRGSPSLQPGRGEPAVQEIRFALATSSLGTVLVASRARGLCAVLLGDDSAILEQELRNRYAGATLIAGGAALDALATVVGLVESPGGEVAVTLDPSGTDFQRSVWAALREIPPGATATYSEIASRIGRPRAVRAVAGACAANPLAIVIPCHRVIRGDRKLGGYRWGLERKRLLLESEAWA